MVPQLTDASDLLNAHLALHDFDDFSDDRVDLVNSVTLAVWPALLQPSHDVEATTFQSLHRYGVTLQQIRHDNEVAVLCELIRDTSEERVSLPSATEQCCSRVVD